MHNEVLDDLVVVKRSGQRVAFNASKVAIAIKKGFESTNHHNSNKIFVVFEKVLNYINDNYKERKTINVEDIQNIIEKTLEEEKCFDTYKSFKEYRERRANSRKIHVEKSEHKFVKAIEKINDYSIDKTSSSKYINDIGKIIASEYTKSYLLDSKSIKAYEEGYIYINNLNCSSLGIFENLVFKANKIKSDDEIDEFLIKITNAHKEIKNEITISNIDSLFEKYFLNEYRRNIIKNFENYICYAGFENYINIKKIKELLEKENEVDINIESYKTLLLNVNIQNVFMSIIDKNKLYLSEKIEKVLLKINNVLENSSYDNKKYNISFGLNESSIGKIINDKIINIINNNKYKNINFIYKLNNNNHKLSLLYNDIWILNTKINEEYFTDGTRVFQDDDNSESSLFGKLVITRTSINMARLGLKFKGGSIKTFYEELDNILETTKNELQLEFENMGNKSIQNYDFLFRNNIYDDEKLEDGQKIRKVIKNGSLNIGLIGLKECLKNLKDNYDDQIKLMFDIMDYLNKKIKTFNEDTKLNFCLYETTDKKARKECLSIDKAIYGQVDKEKYDLIDFDYINDYQMLSKLQNKFLGGKCLNIYVGQSSSNKKIDDTIKLIKDNDLKFVRLKGDKHED